jgi:hypothetical protein
MTKGCQLVEEAAADQRLLFTGEFLARVSGPGTRARQRGSGSGSGFRR